VSRKPVNKKFIKSHIVVNVGYDLPKIHLPIGFSKLLTTPVLIKVPRIVTQKKDSKSQDIQADVRLLLGQRKIRPFTKPIYRNS
jgi:hypothetical protein